MKFSLSLPGLLAAGVLAATVAACASQEVEEPVAAEPSLGTVEPKGACTTAYANCAYGKPGAGPRGGCYSLNHPDRVQECLNNCLAVAHECLHYSHELD